jgi:1-acyl-sn-glycerol-3-phosphate acyltransferase
MREAVRQGHALGLFVEGTRQLNGAPGQVQPGAGMVALQEDVPVVPAAIYGSYEWKPGNWHPISVAWGEPLRFDGLPKNAKGYREASAEVQTRIRGLHAWLGEMHALGRPERATPPT